MIKTDAPTHVFTAPDGTEYECVSASGPNVYGDQMVSFPDGVQWMETTGGLRFEVKCSPGKWIAIKGNRLRPLHPGPTPDAHYRYFDIAIRPMPSKVDAPRPRTLCWQCVINRSGLPYTSQRVLADPTSGVSDDEIREATYELREAHGSRHVRYICWICANRAILATLLMDARATVYTSATGGNYTLPQLYVPEIKEGGQES